MTNAKILVTGGAGYIGSHTCVELHAAGFELVVVDNLSNSKAQALERIESISGRAVHFYQADINDRDALRAIFEAHTIVAVLHFAGLKAVGESSEIPLHYYHNNVSGSIALAEVMDEFAVRSLIFSSSATVYGDPATVPIREDFPTSATNPYGRSKLMVEEILRDLCRAPGKQEASNQESANQGGGNEWKVSLLRYFNPIGAHESGLIGEDPRGIPNNLLPYVSQVAIGKLKELSVFGDDYPTPDGTGIRDYIHVVDLARGHVKALEHLLSAAPECYTFNLGTGQGYSVLQTIDTFEKISGAKVAYRVVGRRPGDIASCYADPQHAAAELGWRADFDLARMVEDTWRWQTKNPEGYV